MSVVRKGWGLADPFLLKESEFLEGDGGLTGVNGFGGAVDAFGEVGGDAGGDKRG